MYIGIIFKNILNIWKCEQMNKFYFIKGVNLLMCYEMCRIKNLTFNKIHIPIDINIKP